MSERVGRLDRYRLLVEVDGFVGPTLAPPVERMTSFEIKMIGLQVFAVALRRLYVSRVYRSPNRRRISGNRGSSRRLSNSGKDIQILIGLRSSMARESRSMA